MKTPLAAALACALLCSCSSFNSAMQAQFESQWNFKTAGYNLFEMSHDAASESDGIHLKDRMQDLARDYCQNRNRQSTMQPTWGTVSQTGTGSRLWMARLQFRCTRFTYDGPKAAVKPEEKDKSIGDITGVLGEAMSQGGFVYQ